MATPIRQLLSQTSYNGDGSTTVWDFSFAGGYIDKAHVKASKIVKATGVVTQIPLTLANFIGAYQLSISPAIPVGTELTVYRDTPKDEPLVNFADRAALTEAALDLNARQAIFVAAESSDGLATAIDSVSQITAYTDLAFGYKNQAGAYADAAYSAAVTAQGARDTVVTSAAQVATDTASALASKNAASTSATNASGSASAASGSASAASGSASGANTSAGNAATSASNANSSAINAGTSASNANTSAGLALAAQTAAELALDSFDDRYLGARATAPTLDNDGATLLTGAIYFDTVIGGGSWRAWNGSAWVTAPVANASSVVNTPAGTIAATTVQAALNELDTEKVATTAVIVIAKGGTGATTANAGADALGAFRKGTLLGTVSQSAGVPTGAVIERGSNANGEYVRFADGTQICRRLVTGWAGANANNIHALPAAFAVSEPAVTWNSVPSENIYTANACWVESGSWYFRHTTAATTQSCVLLAIGRWF